MVTPPSYPYAMKDTMRVDDDKNHLNEAALTYATRSLRPVYRNILPKAIGRSFGKPGQLDLTRMR